MLFRSSFDGLTSEPELWDPDGDLEPLGSGLKDLRTSDSDGDGGGEVESDEPGSDGDEGGVSVVSVDGKFIDVVGVTENAAGVIADVPSGDESLGGIVSFFPSSSGDLVLAVSWFFGSCPPS